MLTEYVNRIEKMLLSLIFFSAMTCLCGGVNPHHHQQQPREGRIIGGIEAVRHGAPFMVLLNIWNGENHENCCGTLITCRHVLTAAHCLRGRQVISMILGAHNIFRQEPTQLRVAAANFKIHSNYSRFTTANDIGLIKLKAPVALNSYVNVIPLPRAEEDYVGKTARIYGWGVFYQEPIKRRGELLTTSLKIISNTACLKHDILNNIDSTNICTDGSDQSGCYGDSGGPLVLNGVQIGVTSRGTSIRCDRGDPSVYTRVAEYLDWIHEGIRSL